MFLSAYQPPSENRKEFVPEGSDFFPFSLDPFSEAKTILAVLLACSILQFCFDFALFLHTSSLKWQKQGFKSDST